MTQIILFMQMLPTNVIFTKGYAYFYLPAQTHITSEII